MKKSKFILYIEYKIYFLSHFVLCISNGDDGSTGLAQNTGKKLGN